MAGNPDFDLYELSDEHRELQAAVRALAQAKIAPRAAEIDETGEFPWDVYEALAASGFHAISIPEEYEGSGGTISPRAWSLRKSRGYAGRVH